MEMRRPDPDRLLEEVRQEEERRKQGVLKIFFGAAPGVGKTYAMLEAARRRREEGVEVVAGIVETHGRAETEALLAGLEALPRRMVDYRGRRLGEFDLDTALTRRPALILVDELAHANAPDSRHKKRWQDVFELLNAGINVYTTVNVQHLESLNDVVEQITGVVVRETFPDSVLDRADEIELVDLPPEELLQRLKEGKVYVAELAAQAREHFFRKGNLIALRELALRRTAERVDAQMQRYRRDKGVREVWPATERILVCVGPNPRSIRLIRAAKRMAAGLRAEWIAGHVEAPSKVRPSESDIRKLAEHMRLAESLGAETVTLSGDTASEEILTYARKRNVTKIIIGKPTHPRWKDRLFGSMLDEVVRGSGDIDVYVITGDTAEPVPRSAAPPAPRLFWRGEDWLWALGPVSLATLVARLMNPYFDLADLAMTYLLAVVITASRARKGPTFLATILSVAALDFFFVPPYHTFAVRDVRYLVTFAVMLLVGFVISRLTLRVRDQAEASRQRETRTAALYSLSRELVDKRNIVKVSDTAARHIGEIFGGQVAVLVPNEEGNLVNTLSGPGTFALDPQEAGVAQWSFQQRRSAGLGTDTLPGAKAHYVPLTASTGAVGVLGIIPGNPAVAFTQEQLHILESFTNQTAMALERIFLAREAQRAKLRAESENMRNTLLSSVSHDLRTPLAAITGASSTLLQQEPVIAPEGRRELVRTIYEEADRLNRIIGNVLDLTRLEAGAIAVKKEWQSLEEILGVVLDRLSGKLKDHLLDIRLPADLPLVHFDPLLIEQVLTNIMENAVKYTPSGTPLELAAAVKGDNLEVSLSDRGPGIKVGDEERIFEKFVRGYVTGGGAGLGLAICRAIVRAHGGRIWAENRPGGGAVFRFTLPIGGTAPMPEPEPET